MEKLEKLIRRSGYRLQFIAEKLEITYVALHNKLIGKNKFTLAEAIRLKRLLDIDESDWKEIFENDIVSASERSSKEN